jgi:hypothetical protein
MLIAYLFIMLLPAACASANLPIRTLKWADGSNNQ